MAYHIAYSVFLIHIPTSLVVNVNQIDIYFVHGNNMARRMLHKLELNMNVSLHVLFHVLQMKT
jgi:hypothetical protein